MILFLKPRHSQACHPFKTKMICPAVIQAATSVYDQHRRTQFLVTQTTTCRSTRWSDKGAGCGFLEVAEAGTFVGRRGGGWVAGWYRSSLRFYKWHQRSVWSTQTDTSSGDKTSVALGRFDHPQLLCHIWYQQTGTFVLQLYKWHCECIWSPRLSVTPFLVTKQRVLFSSLVKMAQPAHSACFQWDELVSSEIC